MFQLMFVAASKPPAASKPLDWSKIGALASGLGALVLLIGAGIAIWQVIEARRLREAQTRPWVVLDLDTKERMYFVTLHITNAGRTVARDVHLDFNPPLKSTLDRPGFLMAEEGIHKDGIPSLPPAVTKSLLFEYIPTRWQEDGKPKTDMPSTYTVTLSYQGPEKKKEPYTDTEILNLNALGLAFYVDALTVHDVAKQLEEITSEMKKWTAEGLKGVLVKTPEGLRRERAHEVKEHDREVKRAMTRQEAGKTAPRHKPKP